MNGRIHDKVDDEESEREGEDSNRTISNSNEISLMTSNLNINDDMSYRSESSSSLESQDISVLSEGEEINNSNSRSISLTKLTNVSSSWEDINTSGSVVSQADSRVEAQRLQIIKNRLLQNQLRDLQSAQKREIDGLKKALGVQSSIVEEKVEANFDREEYSSTFSSTTNRSRLWNQSNCTSIGNIDQIYGNGGADLSSLKVESDAQSLLPQTKAFHNVSVAPKTPLRIRLKRRILRHHRQNTSSSNSDKQGSGKNLSQTEDTDEEYQILNHDSSLHSFHPTTNINKSSLKLSETQSDFIPSTDFQRAHLLHQSDTALAINGAPSLSFESDLDMNNMFLTSTDHISNSCDQKWEDSGDEYYDDDTNDNASHDSLMRLSRQVRLGRRGQMPADKQFNRVMIHVYDLIASETIVKLPWGCDFPLGQCFNMVNSGLHMMGTGAYHVGVEVNGIEYAFGANNVPGLSGVFTCLPRKSAGYDYRCTLDFGACRTVRRSWISVPDPKFTGLTTPKRRRGSKIKKDPPSKFNETYPQMPDLDPPFHTNHPITSIPTVYREVETFVQGHELMQQMAREYLGCDYDLLRKNCCTFARDTCLRLGVKKEEIPSWFLSLAEAGVATENCVAGIESSVVSPLKRILSGLNEDRETIEGEEMDDKNCSGFEVIAKSKRGSVQNTELEIVRIVEAIGQNKHTNVDTHRLQQSVLEDNSAFGNGVGIRHTLSWTY